MAPIRTTIMRNGIKTRGRSPSGLYPLRYLLHHAMGCYNFGPPTGGIQAFVIGNHSGQTEASDRLSACSRSQTLTPLRIRAQCSQHLFKYLGRAWRQQNAFTVGLKNLTM